jgi:Na+-driven multidrug efflux pump
MIGLIYLLTTVYWEMFTDKCLNSHTSFSFPACLLAVLACLLAVLACLLTVLTGCLAVLAGCLAVLGRSLHLFFLHLLGLLVFFIRLLNELLRSLFLVFSQHWIDTEVPFCSLN